MHPLVKKRDDAKSVAWGAEEAAEEAFERALRAGFDASRLRRATPADRVVGAVFWYVSDRKPTDPNIDDDGPSWSVVKTVHQGGEGFNDEEGSCYPYLDNWYVQEGDLAVPPEPVEAILSEDPHAEAVEVWLMDTGYFLVVRDIHPAWWSSLSWRRLMRQRRSLRLYVPPGELAKLSGIENAFSVAKRGYEMGDALKRYREWQEELAVLLAKAGLATGDDEEAGLAREGSEAALDAHWAKELGVLQGAMRGVLGHARVVAGAAPEKASAIRTLPFVPPAVCWEEPKDVKAPGQAKPAKDSKKGGKPA